MVKNRGNYSSLARMLSNYVRNITRIMLRDRVLVEIGILLNFNMGYDANSGIGNNSEE